MTEIKGLNKNATRMLTGLIMGTAAMGCIIEGKIALLAMLLFILYFASKEYVKILNHKGFYPSLKMIYIAEDTHRNFYKLHNIETHKDNM